MAKIFNRKDPQVEKDASRLSLEEFIDKYSDTAATELVLKSVYNSFKRISSRSLAIAQASKASAELVETISNTVIENNIPTDEITVTKVKKHAADTKPRVIVEVEDIRPEPKRKGNKTVQVDEESGEEVIVKDKPGRTPRMRELIKELGKDKALIKRTLEEEGFNTSGSGFHSEWNRISKSM